MFAFTTDDDWSGASVTIDTSDMDSLTYTVTWERSIGDVMTQLASACNANLAGTWTWTMRPMPATSGCYPQLLLAHPSITFSATVDQQWIDLTGQGDVGDVTTWGSDGSGVAAIGTWAPKYPIVVRNNVRLLDAGDACAAGLVRPGVPAFGTYRPTVETIATTAEVVRLTELLVHLGNPRRVAVYQAHTSSWHTFALGTVTREVVAYDRFSCTFAVAGEAL